MKVCKPIDPAVVNAPSFFDYLDEQRYLTFEERDKIREKRELAFKARKREKAERWRAGKSR